MRSALTEIGCESVSCLQVLRRLSGVGPEVKQVQFLRIECREIVSQGRESRPANYMSF